MGTSFLLGHIEYLSSSSSELPVSLKCQVLVLWSVCSFMRQHYCSHRTWQAHWKTLTFLFLKRLPSLCPLLSWSGEQKVVLFLHVFSTIILQLGLKGKISWGLENKHEDFSTMSYDNLLGRASSDLNG